jgi:hypothetical protein
MLLSEILESGRKEIKSRNTFLPTGRLIVGRDAPAQANSERNH